MNWISNVVRPKIQNVFKKRDTPDNLWRKCGSCGEMVFHRDLVAALNVCPNCDHHIKLGTTERLKMLFDRGEYEEVSVPSVPHDPLKFKDQKKYSDRLKDARAKSGREDAVTGGFGQLDGCDVVIAVQDFAFMGGSLGMGAGEAIVKSAEMALTKKCPFIMVAASDGARMQEGILSLMQMSRVTVAIQMLRDEGLPYIVVLTDPTTGGVMASYAMIGDVHIAEPKALLGFSGPRVIEQTIREKLPDGFQRSEYLLEHGMVDMVVHRHALKETLARVIRLMTHRPKSKGSFALPALPAAE